MALTDEEGAVTFASQHFLSLGAFDVTHVPGALVVVGRALVLLQRVGAANTETEQQTLDHVTNKTLSSKRSINYGRRYDNNQPSHHELLSCYFNPNTHSSASFFMPSHSLILFCLVPFCVSHLQSQNTTDLMPTIYKFVFCKYSSRLRGKKILYWFSLH